MHGETGQDDLACRRTCRGCCLVTAHLQKATEGGSAVCLSSRLWEEGNPIRHPRPLRACHACAYTAGRGTPVPFDWLSCALSRGGASSCRSRTLHPCWGLRDVRHFLRLLRYLAPAPSGMELSRISVYSSADSAVQITVSARTVPPQAQ